MGHLAGLKTYLDENYETSIFDQINKEGSLWNFHVHENRIITAQIVENLRYDLKLDIEGQGEMELPKIMIKLLYPREKARIIQPLLKKTDKKVKNRKLEPVVSPMDRFFVKNKSLFPLMVERQVVFLTLLEGEIIRGLIAGFSRYDIIVRLKGGVPVTLLRHSIFDLRDKNGRCFLKSFQQDRKDWQKSKFFVD